MAFFLTESTLGIMSNFIKILSANKLSIKSDKIRISRTYIDIKVQGMIAFYKCQPDDEDRENEGFDEIMIPNPSVFLNLIEQFGFENAEYKDPFIILKNQDKKVKYHTNDINNSQVIHPEKLEAVIKNMDILQEFEYDTENFKDFNNIAKSMKYDNVTFETNSNKIKMIANDKNEVDDGYYEHYIMIPPENQFSIKINREHLNMIFPGKYTLKISDKTILLYHKDIKGLMYIISSF